MTEIGFNEIIFSYTNKNSKTLCVFLLLLNNCKAEHYCAANDLCKKSLWSFPNLNVNDKSVMFCGF